MSDFWENLIGDYPANSGYAKDCALDREEQSFPDHGAITYEEPTNNIDEEQGSSYSTSFNTPEENLIPSSDIDLEGLIVEMEIMKDTYVKLSRKLLN